MRAGKLDRVITLQDITVAAPDEFGTPGENAPAAGVSLRAQIVQSTTEEYLRGYGEGGEAAIIFRVRWVDGVTVDQRLTYEGRAFNVREVKEIGRRRGLELRCEEVRA